MEITFVHVAVAAGVVLIAVIAWMWATKVKAHQLYGTWRVLPLDIGLPIGGLPADSGGGREIELAAGPTSDLVAISARKQALGYIRIGFLGGLTVLDTYKNPSLLARGMQLDDSAKPSRIVYRVGNLVHVVLAKK